ncbi:MAG TPA: arylsulfatase [Tepidisphaeraceae bacterium]|nr:arylsulfatase [Tepidisphaeraceae bacterium]
MTNNPSRRAFLNYLTTSAIAAALPGCAHNPDGAPAATIPRKPNIIFILADDLGYGDLACYGSPHIQTPNLDRLAAQGTRFTNCYSGATVCAPSRCCLMTGLHTGHAYIRGNANINLRPQDTTVAEVLQSAGYTTALIGKWGLGEDSTPGVPNRQGFDYFFGYLNQTHAHNSYPTFLYRNQERIRLRNVVPKEGKFGQGVATERLDFSNDLFTDEILSFLDRSKDKPFFLYAAYTACHANNEGNTIDVPDLGIYKDRDWPEPQKRHAALVTRLDTYVGQILQKLQDLGLDDNTLVVFASDNGPHKEGRNNPEWSHSSGPFRGIKRDLYDGGIRVPLIARWPGHVPAGRTSEQLLAFWDFLPTAADLAQAPVPANLDGISMLPALLGKRQKSQHEFLYWEFHEGGFKQAVRMGNYKAIRLAPNKPIELYDITRDLGESRNIAQDHPNTIRKIEAYLATARTESKEFPIRIPQPKPAKA